MVINSETTAPGATAAVTAWRQMILFIRSPTIPFTTFAVSPAYIASDVCHRGRFTSQTTIVASFVRTAALQVQLTETVLEGRKRISIFLGNDHTAVFPKYKRKPV